MADAKIGYKKVPLNFIRISRHHRLFKNVFKAPGFTLCNNKQKFKKKFKIALLSAKCKIHRHPWKTLFLSGSSEDKHAGQMCNTS